MSDSVSYTTHPVHFEEATFRMVVRNGLDSIQGLHREGRFYEAEELALMRTMFPPASVVVDVGTNVGNHAVFFAGVCRARQVIAFEVNPVAIDLLRRNVQINALTSIDLSHVGKAVSDRARQYCLMDEAPNNLGGAYLTEQKDGPIGSIILDDALAGLHVDFLKIDVEGTELEVLKGARRTIRRCRPPIFIEVLKRNRRPFFDLARRYGYRIERTICRYRDIYNFVLQPDF